MRRILLASSFAVLVAAMTNPAYAGRYCLQGTQWGYPGACDYATYHQCMASASGTNAHCGINPHYAYRHHRGQVH